MGRNRRRVDRDGLGGYLAAMRDAEHYQAEREREEEVKGKTEAEIAEVTEVFRSYGVTDSRPA